MYDYFAVTHIRHTDRKWYDTPFVFEPWQFDNIWLPIFGTLDAKGNRYYNKALIGLPRYYGKSEDAARIVLTIMAMEPVFEGDYGIVATSKPQARIVFRKVVAMVRLDPLLSAMFEIRKDIIIHKATGANFAVYPAEEAAVQGKHFVVAVIDEAHAHKNTALYEAVVSGMKGQDGSLLIVITTAASKRKGPLWDFMLPTLTKDPRAYVYWLGASDKDDPRDPATWKKVCVASWISMASIRDQFNSTSLASFMQYTLNMFPPDGLGADMAFDADKVDACITSDRYDWDAVLALGIDGAVSSDSFALVFTYDDGGTIHAYPIIYLKGESTDQYGRYNLPDIEDSVVDYWSSHDVARIAADPAKLQQFFQHLYDRHGIPIESFTQNTWAAMASASQNVKNLIDSDRLQIHGPHAARLAEHLKNCTRYEGSRDDGMWRMGKMNRTDKNDGAIALAISAIILDATDMPSMEIVTF